ncbi:MAG TPA: nitrogenase component 1 [Candidatus Sumerlaeota bacterium]|nr:nitrogenase component 1 [Candidatus Sumerlaeota bacterium]
MKTRTVPTVTVVQNACKLCAPLGACLAFRGVEGALPFLHGSLGCATYIRRYIIGHFREPMDVASSSFDEYSAAFGGTDNLERGLSNATEQYRPKLIGIASTCLSETLGDDLPTIVKQSRVSMASQDSTQPILLTVSTPSYRGTHETGFRLATLAITQKLAGGGERRPNTLNLFPGILSPADFRHLREITAAFGLDTTILPDYSDTLDGPALADYELIPQGGTPINRIVGMGTASASISFDPASSANISAGAWLENEYGVPETPLGVPIGLRETDLFFRSLEEISGRPTPVELALERGRLVDAYVDIHKFLFGKKVVLYGEETLVVGLASFLAEIGCMTLFCATGEQSGCLENILRERLADYRGDLQVVEGADFTDIAQAVEEIKPDLMVGNSKGYPVARKYSIPLVRVGFPVHDRFGAQRILHVGYRGTQQLLDRIANEILGRAQDSSPVGYTHF